MERPASSTTAAYVAVDGPFSVGGQRDRENRPRLRDGETGVDDMERELVRLAAEVKQGFEALRRELEIDRENDERRHQETRHRLDAINGRVGKAHDRASALEAVMATLQARVENIATRTHQRMNEVTDWMSKLYGRSFGEHQDNGDVDKDQITVSRLKFYVWLVGGTVAAVLGVLRLMGKL